MISISCTDKEKVKEALETIEEILGDDIENFSIIEFDMPQGQNIVKSIAISLKIQTCYQNDYKLRI